MVNRRLAWILILSSNVGFFRRLVSLFFAMLRKLNALSASATKNKKIKLNQNPDFITPIFMPEYLILFTYLNPLARPIFS